MPFCFHFNAGKACNYGKDNQLKHLCEICHGDHAKVNHKEDSQSKKTEQDRNPGVSCNGGGLVSFNTADSISRCASVWDTELQNDVDYNYLIDRINNGFF